MNQAQVRLKAALLAALAATSLVSSLALAQQKAPAAAPPPPELEVLEEGPPPSVTIKKQGDAPSTGNSVTERRDHGQTTEVKVQSGPSTYYLKPTQQVGTALPGDAQSGPATPAQWVIKEFDWGGSKAPQQNSSDNK